jgi:hypothetical protein
MIRMVETSSKLVKSLTTTNNLKLVKRGKKLVNYGQNQLKVGRK